MDEHVYKSHNKTLLLYHIVCPAKYRKRIFTEEVNESLINICKEIELNYEVKFIEIGVDDDHVHFLVQSVPNMSVSRIAKTIKGITGREILKKHERIKKELWGGNLWTSGYYANTVGQYGNKDVIQRYVQNQGKKYSKIHDDELTLFDGIL